MTKQEAYIKHYQMWDELVNHPEWDKPQTSFYTSRAFNSYSDNYSHCFLCLSVGGESFKGCNICPLFKVGMRCYTSNDDYYTKWWKANCDETRIYYATLIRDCVIPYLTKASKIKLGLEAI